MSAKPRDNQRRRTRKDLLQAAARLLRQGSRPTLADVAEEALVSRATAYRYFPSIEALLVEAPIDGAVPDPDTLFGDDASSNVEDRIDRAEAALHEVVFANEPQLRAMLAHVVAPRAKDVPVRQNRRQDIIEAALAPARKKLGAATYRRLCRALALVFGTESMIVFRDVLGLDSKAARQTKSWAVRALVRAALAERARKPVRS
jgi:AcrR family transcriptional regulator